MTRLRRRLVQSLHHVARFAASLFTTEQLSVLPAVRVAR